MEQTKVYKLLTYFDRIEHNRLRKFVASPYFNPNEHVLNLYQILREHLFANSNKELEKESVWEALELGRGDYDDVYFRKLCSDLVKLIEQYLAQQVYEKDEVSKKIDLIEAVGNRKIEPLFNSSVKAVNILLDNSNLRYSEHYFREYKKEKNFYELFDFELNRAARLNLKEIVENLDIFFLSEKLKYLCTAESQKSIATYDYSFNLVEETLKHVEEHYEQYQAIPSIAIYFQIYLTQTKSEADSNYFMLKNLIFHSIGKFPVEEAQQIYRYTLNYCARQINKGNPQFLEEYFEIYVDALEKNTMFDEEGELSPWHFRNLVVSALRLGKYDWVEEFIQNYQEKLPENMRENAVSYNLASLHFYKKNYEEVIFILQSIDYEDITYNLNSKTMLLMTYYELDEIEPLFSLLDSFRTYLGRHKDIPANRRKLYNNLIRFTRALTKIIPGDQKAIQKLRSDIEKEKGIASEPWLLEKLLELE